MAHQPPDSFPITFAPRRKDKNSSMPVAQEMKKSGRKSTEAVEQHQLNKDVTEKNVMEPSRELKEQTVSI